MDARVPPSGEPDEVPLSWEEPDDELEDDDDDVPDDEPEDDEEPDDDELDELAEASEGFVSEPPELDEHPLMVQAMAATHGAIAIAHGRIDAILMKTLRVGKALVS